MIVNAARRGHAPQQGKLLPDFECSESQAELPRISRRRTESVVQLHGYLHHWAAGDARRQVELERELALRNANPLSQRFTVDGDLHFERSRLQHYGGGGHFKV